jgi:hypothetical protein
MSESMHANTDQPTIVYGSGRKPDAAIPRPGVEFRKNRVAVVVTDPQNDFLSPDGVTWGVVGRNVIGNNTVENIGQLLVASKDNNVPLFISPHYYYPQDHQWRFEGALERLMHDINMFDRPHALDLTNFEGSGADWLTIRAMATAPGARPFFDHNYRYRGESCPTFAHRLTLSPQRPKSGLPKIRGTAVTRIVSRWPIRKTLNGETEINSSMAVNRFESSSRPSGKRNSTIA